MMSEKYTPGPWRIAGTATGYITNTGKGGRVQVAVVGAYDDKELLPFNKERWDADARLIAAAPDLYEALDAIATGSFKGASTLAINGNWQEMVQQFQNIARAALSKAATP
jgi:hypothetical protein